MDSLTNTDNAPGSADKDAPCATAGGPHTAAPRFSVIIPAYNASAYLHDTIGSVLAQTYGNWELVIVDDGSTDDTAEIARAYASRDARVRVLQQPNGGCSSASNTAWRAACGEFICILGADDLYRPEYLAEQSRFIDANPGYDLYSCNAENLFEDGSTAPYFTDARHREVVSFELEDWFESCPIFGLAIFRRDLAERLGGYRVTFRNAEDYDFWLRAMASGARHRHNPATLAFYRRHRSSKSSNRVAAARAVLRILEDLRATADLTPAQTAHLDRVLVRRRAAVERRELEQRMLTGDYTGARKAFGKSRDAYGSRTKYALAAAIVMVSPALYTRLVLAKRR